MAVLAGDPTGHRQGLADISRSAHRGPSRGWGALIDY